MTTNTSGRAAVVRGDARALPLPDDSVDLIVTSPPYYRQRAYTDDSGRVYNGQIGDEPTLVEYVDTLLGCTREWIRVLKPSGSLWVNLGDKYSDGSQVPGKSLLGAPWRYALSCVDQLGLILRAEVIWDKPNAIPESAGDRVRRSHEQWFHLVQQPRYYSAVDEIREAPSGYAWPNGNGRAARGGQRPRMMLDSCNPLGKLPSSVWEIPSEPLRVPDHLGVEHFAAFPSEWPRRIVRGWSPPGICTACGQGRRPNVVKQRQVYHGQGRYRSGAQQRKDGADVTGWRHDEKWNTTAVIAGYCCGCPAPDAATRPAVVLDPFGGTGTVALVAAAFGRVGISVDRSGDYCRLAQWRVGDPDEQARAAGVPRPPKQVEGQMPLWSDSEVPA